MTKSEICDKQRCLLRIIFEVASNRDQLWKLLGWTVFKNPNFNPFQTSSVLPMIHDICCFCYVILTFPQSFNVSLSLMGILQLPNLAEFRETAPLRVLNEKWFINKLKKRKEKVCSSTKSTMYMWLRKNELFKSFPNKPKLSLFWISRLSELKNSGPWNWIENLFKYWSRGHVKRLHWHKGQKKAKKEQV